MGLVFYMPSYNNYYHIRLMIKKEESSIPTAEYELELTYSDIQDFSKQYTEELVFFNRRWIDSSNIREIEIRETLLKCSTYASNKSSASSIIFHSSPPKGDVVTRYFIKKPPPKKIKSIVKEPVIRSEDVFIVHGTDHKPMQELKNMLKKIGLNPIVLHEQASGSKTIVEKLEEHSDVGYTFVILTPDDIGKSKYDAYDMPRARQNVILEFGYFIGKLSRNRVCCLYTGDVELPSDMQGIVYIPFEKSINECSEMIIKEVKKVGYNVNI